MNVTLGPRPRAAMMGAAAAVVVLGAFFLLQDYRHAWPFSRHHDAHREAPGLAGPIPSGGGATDAASRVPIAVDAARLDTLAIRFELAKLETVAQPVRAVATVVPDEARISHVHTRVSGWVEQLYVNTTGQFVRAGQPLAAVFSQELYSSQNEYIAALRQARDGPSSAVLDAARMRLNVLGMTEAEVSQVERSGQARRLVTIGAPRSGVVLHRGVTVGTAVDPSTEIVTVADLSSVWVLAEVPESEAVRLALGAPATLSFTASGLASFTAPIEFIYPTLTERTRTVRMRFVVPNPEGRLRPGVYGSAEFDVAPRDALTVSRDAVVDTGAAQHVFVRTAAGMLEPRTVKIGARLGERIEVMDGLSPGEQVAATGVFLIDSESRLRASGAGGGHAGHGGVPSEPPAEGEQEAETPPAQHPDHGD